MFWKELGRKTNRDVTTPYRCPSCCLPSFRQRGYALICDSCGWNSFTSCGADGFSVPISMDGTDSKFRQQQETTLDKEFSQFQRLTDFIKNLAIFSNRLDTN